jgi:hypothetical protein
VNPAFLQVSEQVWLPIHVITRVSQFGDVVTITTQYGVDHYHGEDARRILIQLKPIL